MYLAANTFVYEVGQVSIKDTLRSAYELGFKYIDLAAYDYGDPTRMSAAEKKDVLQMFKDYGFVSSQFLLANTEHIASPDKKKRQDTMDYMKHCTDFQLELGGRQVLICWAGEIVNSKKTIC